MGIQAIFMIKVLVEAFTERLTCSDTESAARMRSEFAFYGRADTVSQDRLFTDYLQRVLRQSAVGSHGCAYEPDRLKI